MKGRGEVWEGREGGREKPDKVILNASCEQD